MKRSKRKLKTRLAKRVLAGKITVDDARRKLGRNMTQKSAVPSLAKAESARANLAAEADWLAAQRHFTTEAMRDAAAAVRSARPVTEQDVLDAARPMTRPAVTKAAVPAAREHPLQVLKALKNYQSPVMEGPARIHPAASWTGVQLALLRKSQVDPDPRERENARATLARELGGKVVF